MAQNETLGLMVWMDLEMTGLNLRNDVILETACVITDGDLNVVEEGPSFVIYQSDEKLDAMGKWCKEHHGKSGLIDAVRQSTTTIEQAETETFEFIKKHCQPLTGILTGNTVWQDRLFIQRFMPTIMPYLHYRIVDVSSIKELVKRWYPNNASVAFKKSDGHRALSDIYESIAELAHYRKNFFV